MANVTVEKTTYKVDKLYQWDRDQELFIYGLSLATIPEIHFTNDAMNKAIVRQATVDARGVISVKIPNSLLQKSLKIRVYVCTYEGDTFRSLYLITIPVIARNMPADYTLTVSDEEVYSFNELENKIEKVVQENGELRYDLMAEYSKESQALQTSVEKTKKELQDNVANTTKELNDRVNNIIANASDTTGNSELADIRLGADGTLYKSAGEAVRKQIDNIKYFTRDITSDVVILGALLETAYAKKDSLWDNTPVNNMDDYFSYSTEIKAGDIVALAPHVYIPGGYSDKVVVLNDGGRVVEIVNHDTLTQDRYHVFTHDGTAYFSWSLPNGDGLIFTIKRPNALQKTLFLDEGKAEEYLTNTTLGDEVLQALITGRQILVRVPNADGKNYTANYMPIIQNQVPNTDNEYLYLIYLKDGIANNFMTALQTGELNVVFGQLKMKLSKVYNSDPLREV